MILVKHCKDFYTIHLGSSTDGSYEEAIYIKCKRAGVDDNTLDRGLDAMRIYNHNACYFEGNVFITSYKLGEM